MWRVVGLVMLVSCGGAESKRTAPIPVAPVAPTPVVTAVPAHVDVPPPVVVDAKPDTPTGAAAERDAELAAKAATFFDAFNNNDGAFTRDGKRVVFASNRDGFPQLYVAELTGAATRITTTSQRISSFVMTPDGKSIVFASDTNADENWSFFRIGVDGKDLVELTPNAPLSRDRPMIADGRPDQLVFIARKLNGPGASIYTLSVSKPGEPNLVYTSDVLALADVATDGKSALVGENAGPSGGRLLRLDLDKGETKVVYPPKDVALMRAAKLSRDGKRVYVSVYDVTHDEMDLVMVEIATGKELAKRTFALPMMPTGIELAKKGDVAAISFDSGDHSEIQLVDARTLAKRVDVAMPKGTGTATRFSEDGKRLLATWSTPTSPNDLYVIDARTGKVTPRAEARPTLANAPAVDITQIDIPAFDGGKIPTIAYVPHDEQTKPHPVFFFFHGGPAQVWTIRWSAMNSFYTSLGYVVVEPNVRGSGGYGKKFQDADNGAARPDSFRDIESAAQWAAAQPWADKTRMVMAGGSYGGYLTLVALAKWPTMFRAGVDLFGSIDLAYLVKSAKGIGRKNMAEEFGDPDKDVELMRATTPVLTNITVPLFVYAGANDPRVPIADHDDVVVKSMRERKMIVEYMVSDKEGHRMPTRRDTNLELHSRIARFLEGVLK